MKAKLYIIIGSLVLGLAAHAQPTLKSVKTAFKDGQLKVEYTFDSNVEGLKNTVEYINSTVQVDLPGAKLAKQKDVQDIGADVFRNVYTYMSKPQVLRSRIILAKDQAASIFKDRVEIQVSGNRMSLVIPSSGAAQKDIPAVPPPGLEEESEKSVAAIEIETADDILERELTAAGAMIPQEEKTKTDKKTSAKEKVDSAQVDANKNLKESEIPLFTKKASQEKKMDSPIFRMLASLAIIGIVGAGLVLFARRWSKTHKRNDLNNQIRVLVQHHIGPKKTLAIVRVAGEHILVGITDHNISMLKTLSLIDDEFPEDVPTQFNDTLLEKQAQQQEDEDFSFGNVKEVVSRRLKEMRSFE